MESILDLVKHYQLVIEKYPYDEQMVLKCIDEMYKMDITVQHLQETGIGRTVNALRKEPGDRGRAARALVYKWKLMVAAEESDQEGDQHNEVKDYNGHEQGKDYDSNQSASKSRKDKPEKHDKVKKTEEKHKQSNGDHSGSKRKYHSSEEDEPDIKKTKYTSTKDNGYIKQEIKVKVEPSDSEDNSTSEEECKPDVKVKIEKVEKTEKRESSSNKHSSYSNHDRIKNEHGSENTKEHHKHNNSEARYSSEKSSKDKSNSSRSGKSSKESEKNVNIEKEHKLDKEKKHREDSIDKHKSTKEQKHTSHNSEKHKSHENSEKRRSDSSTEKHNSEKHRSSSSNVEKHRSSNSSEKHKSSSEKSKGHSEKSLNISEKHSSNKSEKHNLKSTSEKEVSSDKHKSKETNIGSSSSSSKEKHTTSNKERSKDKHSSPKEKSQSHKNDKKDSSSKDSPIKNIDKKKRSDSNSKESSSKKSKHKSSSEKSNSSKSKEDIPKKKSQSNDQDSDDGIDCGSGASFAEALGMISPAKPKKKSFTKDNIHSPNSFSEDLSPAAMLAPSAKLPPLPTLEILALPEISPNYRPRPPPKFLPHFTEEDAMSAVISSKNQRTKVYSGNKVMGKIPTLYEMCVNILQEHIDALEYTGGVPYEILKPVVDKASPQQLFMLEHYNPYLMEDTDHLWQKFCERSFRNKKRQELETWREMFMRCQEEQEIKLKSLTTNIRIAQEAKKAPIKQTKMAYVDSVVKPPRNVLKKQAQHGTAFAATASPAARVAALSSAPNVLKGGRAAPAPVITPSSALKPKKAPLMQKALQFMRGRKR